MTAVSERRCVPSLRPLAYRVGMDPSTISQMPPYPKQLSRPWEPEEPPYEEDDEEDNNEDDE